MLDSECDTGVKVICLDWGWDFRLAIGVITTVIRVNGKVESYLVKDKVDGTAIGGMWYCLTAWDVYLFDEAPVTLRSTPSKSIECPCGIHRSRCDYHK